MKTMLRFFFVNEVHLEASKTIVSASNVFGMGQ